MPASTLTATLRQARKVRRWSQFELSLRMGVSQRHISFVESGRAQPSRELLIAWLQQLDAPLVVRNAAMLQAGFAPVYSTAILGDPLLAEAEEALVQLLRAHDPMPAMVIDAHWNLLHFNRGARWLAATLVPWAPPLSSELQVNLLDLLIHPDGLTRSMQNLREKGPTLLAQLRNEASVLPELVPKVEAFAALLSSRLGRLDHVPAWTRPSAPVLTTRFASPFGELSFFSMFSTFGTPQDITLASLRVEHLFAADPSTREVITAQVLL